MRLVTRLSEQPSRSGSSSRCTDPPDVAGCSLLSFVQGGGGVALVVEREAIGEQAGSSSLIRNCGNSAARAALHLARYARHVSILMRGESLAESRSQYLIRELDAAANIEVRPLTEIADVHGERRLESVERVASAVGEGSVVIQEVHRYLAALAQAKG
jgi:hypothetical protein